MNILVYIYFIINIENPESNESINFLKWLNDKYSNKSQQLQYSMGRFPLVESIYCSVLLKHTGLLEKAEKIINSLVSGDVAVDLNDVLNDEDNESFTSLNTSVYIYIYISYIIIIIIDM